MSWTLPFIGRSSTCLSRPSYRGTRFALCGSSARKVKRGHANLLGDRGLRCEMYGPSAREIGAGVNVITLLNHEYIPRIYESRQPKRYLNAYVSQYLKEEIAEEGLVRNLPAFSELLHRINTDNTTTQVIIR